MLTKSVENQDNERNLLTRQLATLSEEKDKVCANVMNEADKEKQNLLDNMASEKSGLSLLSITQHTT